MINCQEVADAIAGDQLADASWRKRLSIRLHLEMCKPCRSYKEQMAAIGDSVRDLFGKDPAPRPGLEASILEHCLGGCPEADAADEASGSEDAAASTTDPKLDGGC